MPDRRPFLPTTAERGADGRLMVGGCVLEHVAAAFGTPTFVVDEASLRQSARLYLEAFSSWHADTRVYFASKAFPCRPVVQTLVEEGLGTEVAGGGELAIALAAGAEAQDILVHGNAKTDAELQAAVEAGVGLVVVDGPDDLDRLERLGASGQPVLLRVNPGVRAETHAALATGHSGSKFGVSIEAAPAVLRDLERSSAVELSGLHIHLGSQLTDFDAFEPAIQRLATLGSFDVYDLGGGLGVPYNPADDVPSVDDYAERVVRLLHAHLGRDVRLLVEPGRSMVARSALTLYRVVTVKRDGTTTFVAVDGGMADNLEPMLYGTRFEPIALTATGRVETFQLVGRQCETGDVLVEDAELPAQRPGDLIALPATGAYCYSLLNNYNGALRPPVVFCADGRATLRVLRETHADLLARDVVDPQPVVLDSGSAEQPIKESTR
jgi:diaminopimelate decarboxylase